MRTLILASTAFCFVAACSAKPPAEAVAPSTVTTTTQAVTVAEPACDVVCEGARVVAQPAEQPDYHAQAVANANAVFATMHGDLLACYKKRLSVDPNAHAFLTVDAIIGPEGRIAWIGTTGGARLGKEGVACIVDRIREATFEPVTGGGTRRIQVPLTFRRVGSGETI